MSSLVTRPSYIHQRLADEETKPCKAMGQNFLADGNIMQLIVDAARIQETDTVLEIGPGLNAADLRAFTIEYCAQRPGGRRLDAALEDCSRTR